MICELVRETTPVGAGSAVLLQMIAESIAPLLAVSDAAARVALGFPGALRDGVVLAAPISAGRNGVGYRWRISSRGASAVWCI